jgi:hypothetical protein
MSLGGGITPGGSVEVVSDNPVPGGSAIQYVSPSGMYSHSTISPTGIDLTIRGPIDIGRRSDTGVADRAITMLRNEGHEVILLSHQDAKGEDRKVTCDGRTLSIQVIGIPAVPTFLGEASRGSAATSGALGHVANWIADAVAKKGARYPEADKARMLLALDTRAVGVLSSTVVVGTVQRDHGDLPRRYGFAGVLLSGPSDSRSTQIGTLLLPPAD